MSRRVSRVKYTLNPKGITNLPFEEIKAILRGADGIIMQGGRTLLAKILKGSREKKILEPKLDQNPYYGFYKQLPIDQIAARIDWVIMEGYLRIEYDYRLPLLVYTKLGWYIEKDTYSDEMLLEFDKMINSGAKLFNMRFLKDRDRELIMMLLDKVQNSNNNKYIPILKAWEKIDYKKVRKRIQSVISHLKE